MIDLRKVDFSRKYWEKKRELKMRVRLSGCERRLLILPGRVKVKIVREKAIVGRSFIIPRCIGIVKRCWGSL